MKLSKIKALCMEGEQCWLFHCGEGQMIGTGTALYSTDGVEIAEADVPGLFDLDEKQKKKMRVGTIEALDTGKTVTELRQSMMTVKGVDEFIPLTDENGTVYFIKARKAEAASGKAEYRRYLLNIRSDGTPIIRVMDGMEKACAYIAPITEAAARVLMREMEAIGTGTPGRTAPDPADVSVETEHQTSMLEDE